MRRLVTWVLITLGIAVLIRRLRRRREEPESPAMPAPSDPADELRRKLADAHLAAPTPEQPTSGGAPSSEPTVEERRAEVHTQGRSAVDEMSRPPAEE